MLVKCYPCSVLLDRTQEECTIFNHIQYDYDIYYYYYVVFFNYFIVLLPLFFMFYINIIHTHINESW